MLDTTVEQPGIVWTEGVRDGRHDRRIPRHALGGDDEDFRRPDPRHFLDRRVRGRTAKNNALQRKIGVTARLLHFPFLLGPPPDMAQRNFLSPDCKIPQSGHPWSRQTANGGLSPAGCDWALDVGEKARARGRVGRGLAALLWASGALARALSRGGRRCAVGL